MLNQVRTFNPSLLFNNLHHELLYFDQILIAPL